eukprot:TRINITY_DN5459_c0_g1_i2.p1 TRINITY_DN5459_c0_g1~~TRINITY_DN5459_c0_g1_i2.p1  ORF type:complete len:385 (+),score=75.93 TRINITY_DN5459_c0_g1_i2:28-1182(+)
MLVYTKSGDHRDLHYPLRRQRQMCIRDSSHSTAMIRYILDQRQQIWGFELGNEVNNRHIKCGIQAAQQARAFKVFEGELAQLYPDSSTRPKLVGPDVGYLASEEWLGDFLTNFSNLHAVTYHVYSWLKKTNYNSAQAIDNAQYDLKWYPAMVRELAPGAQIWAGEDGPISAGEDGDCGGNTSVCGTYATVMWYANDLGNRAAHGFKQYHRQDLVGGRYSLLGVPHDDQYLDKTDGVRIHPDFWVAFMWKRVMGSTVLNATANGWSPDPSIRAYAHCGVPPSMHVPSAVSETNAPMGWALVNIANTSREVQFASNCTIWTMTSADGPLGNSVNLNNQLLPASIQDGVPISNIPVAGDVKPTGALIELPALSVSFVVIDSPGCGSN